MATVHQHKETTPLPPTLKPVGHDNRAPTVTVRSTPDVWANLYDEAKKRPLASNNPFRKVHVKEPKASSPQDVYIGVVGVTGSGKSTLIQRLTGDQAILVYDTLHSGTKEVQKASLKLGDTTIHLVDTPGFNDSEMEDEDVYYRLTDWIKDTHDHGRKFSGLLYLHPMNRTREKGSDIRSLKIFKRLVGANNYERVVIGMTFLDLEEASVVATREAQLRSDPGFWGDLISAGARVIRIETNKTAECKAVIADLAGLEAVTLQIEDELCNQGKSADQTGAMSEMPHAEELKLLKLQEEYEEKAQQMVYEERARVMAAFSKEREELENLIFSVQQARQEREEEVLLWKSQCEKEQQDYKNLQRHHQRIEETWRLEKERMKREMETRALKENLEEESKQLAKESNQAYAERQIRKRWDWIKAQNAIVTKCMSAGPPKQQGTMISSNLGTQILLPGNCDLCLKIVKLNDPVCIFKQKNVSEAEQVSLDVCTKCVFKAHEVFPETKWEPEWVFALMEEPMTCGLEDGVRRKCTSCSEYCDGVFSHCCECDCKVNFCIRCWVIRGKTCKKPDDHTLRASFQYEPKLLKSIYPDQ